MDLGKLFNHEVVITPSHNKGIIMKIGCGTFCYSNATEFLDDAKLFLDNPEKWETEYNRISGGREVVIEPPQAPQTEGVGSVPT